MINPFTEIDWNPGEEQLRTFGRSMLIGFSIIALIFLAVDIYQGSSEYTTSVVIFFAGVLLYVISYLGRVVALPFYILWHLLGASIGIVVANLLLGIFYYLFFSVFAVMFRILSGRDPLMLKKDVNRKSWWLKISRAKELKSYFRQY